MKTSELIEKLQECVETFGDLDILLRGNAQTITMVYDPSVMVSNNWDPRTGNVILY